MIKLFRWVNHVFVIAVLYLGEHSHREDRRLYLCHSKTKNGNIESLEVKKFIYLRPYQRHAK